MCRASKDVMFQALPDRYPRRTTLADGTPCSIRPLQAEDEGVFRSFHRSIPEAERVFVHRDVLDGSLVRSWTGDPGYQATLPLMAFVDGHPVAFGVLDSRPGGWKRHIGTVTLLTHPDHHGRGLIDHLLEELVTVARDRGLARLESEFNGERRRALQALAMFGFEELVRLPGYVQDMNADLHDYVLMGFKLVPDEDNLGAGD
jgi:GNAT superfamily N-acetyltransferase